MAGKLTIFSPLFFSFYIMVKVLLILVSITTEDRKPLAATAITCSYTAFVLSSVLLPSNPLAPRALVSCWNGFEGRCSSSPLLSLPLFSSWLTYWAYWEKQRVKQNLVRREKCISLKVMQEERVPQQRRSMGLVYVVYDVHLHFQDSVPCSVQISTTLHFRVKSPWKRFLPGRWDQKGQRNATSYTRTSCETPVITSHFSLPQLCHSRFFTQNPPLTLSLQITRAKSLMLALNTAAAKLNFAHSVWKFWSSSVRNKLCGNHVYISFQLKGAL